jgi:nitrous oxidase accessory protein
MQHLSLFIKLFTGLFLTIASTATAQRVSSVEALVTAVAEGKSGAVIELTEGTFRLSQPLDLKSGITLKGAGIGKTIVTNAETWTANPAALPDPETNHQKFDRGGYLLRLADKAEGVTVSYLTLTGPQMHGAIFGFGNKALKLHHLRIEDFMYSGIRTYSMSHAEIHDCTFVDAGQRWERGKPGVKGGITGGGIFVIWMSDSEIWNNRFLRTKTAPNEHYYGIKGRQGKRCHIHHNTI